MYSVYTARLYVFLAEYLESIRDIVFFLPEEMYGFAHRPESPSVTDSE